MYKTHVRESVAKVSQCDPNIQFGKAPITTQVQLNEISNLVQLPCFVQASEVL